MPRKNNRYLSGAICFMMVSLAMNFGAGASMTSRKFADIMGEIKSGVDSTARTKASEQLFDLIRTSSPDEFGENSIDDIINILESSDDSVAYWMARCLGQIGEPARKSIPVLQKKLIEVNCILGSKTSASGIRFALIKLGARPKEDSACKVQTKDSSG